MSYDDLISNSRMVHPIIGKRNSITSNSTASYKEYEREKNNLSIGTTSVKKVTLPLDINENERLNINETQEKNKTEVNEEVNYNELNAQMQAIGSNKNKNAAEGESGFLQKLLNKKKKKNPSLNIDDLIKPTPPLPMVKFDDDGDFFKEPLESKNFNKIILV